MKNINRYPGLTPFETKQKDLFFGRDDDSEKLYAQIKLQQTIVLYGKSGYGKSSLINAGIVPQLIDDKQIKPQMIRLGAYTGEQLSPVHNFLSKVGSNTTTDSIFNRIYSSKDTFWLAVSEIPQYFFDAYETYNNQKTNAINQSEKELISTPLNVKLLFSIRSDRMSHLDRLREFIPSILRNTYELKALEREQAEDAVLFPASIKNEKFDTPPFDYSDAALNKMFAFLTKSNTQNVESFQLQIVCRYCENAVNNGKFGKIIQETDLKNLDDVFRNHYLNQLNLITNPQQQLSARKAIEDVLIVDGNRVSMPGAVLLKQDGMSELLIRKLVDIFLLRAEPSPLGGFTYELTHDTLVAPILEARQTRIDKEEAEQQLRIRNEELRMAKEKAAKDRRRLFFVLLALIFALGLSGIAIWKWIDAENQKQIADDKTILAEKKQQEADSLKNLAIDKQNELTKAFEKLDIALEDAKAQKDTALIKKLEAEQSELYARGLLNKANALLKAFLPKNVKNIYKHFKTAGDKQFVLGEYYEE